jgi:ribose transport system ATP-binding protein
VQSSSVSKNELIEAIIGRRLDKFFPPKGEDFGPELVKIENLTRDDNLKEVNLSLRAGEIVGLAGLEGQGQHVLLSALFGADFSSTKKGEIHLSGKKINLAHPQYPARAGFGYVPGNRQTEGLVLNLTVRENISLPGLDKRARRGFIRSRLENDIADSNIQSLRIKTLSRETPVGNLSGGNQQKVVLAKWLAAESDILIVDEPTRGVDIGTRADIYALMRELANQGKAIIFCSRDLDEVLGLSDRVAVIYGGRIVDQFKTETVSKQQILDIITRVPEEENREQGVG